MWRSSERSGDVKWIASRKSGDDLRTVTPVERTCSGRRGSATATRFWTSTCALLRSVPSLNVIVSVIVPSVVLCDDM